MKASIASRTVRGTGVEQRGLLGEEGAAGQQTAADETVPRWGGPAEDKDRRRRAREKGDEPFRVGRVGIALKQRARREQDVEDAGDKPGAAVPQPAAGDEKQPGGGRDQQGDGRTHRPQVVGPEDGADPGHGIVSERRALVDRVPVKHPAIQDHARRRGMDGFVHIPERKTKSWPAEPQ
jgi:hypothetical protein